MGPDLTPPAEALHDQCVFLMWAVGLLLMGLLATVALLLKSGARETDGLKTQITKQGEMATLLSSTQLSNVEVRAALTEVGRRLERLEDGGG